MSLRTKIVLLNAAVLAIALLSAAVAVGGLWAVLGPLHRVVEEEAHAVAVAERLGLQPAQTEVIEAALESARATERAIAQTVLIASIVPVALLAAGGLASAVFTLALSRRLLVRLTGLADATRYVAEGGRAERVPTGATESGAGRSDELDSLIADFNRMVDQLARAEARAREADLLKSRFFSGVSHDLRTPLTTIAGLLESLRREEWDDTTRDEFLEVAHREALRLTRLVSDLLDLSRLEARGWALDREPVDVPALCRSLVADLSVPGGPLTGREVVLRTSGRCVAWGDDSQLRRVLQNLLTNAARFSPGGTTITLETYGDPGDDSVRVAVADRGRGVAPADAPRIFDRFYRGATTADGRDTVGGDGAPAGTGLGLAIAKGIVESHGGRIWVENVPTGGARFVFLVPASIDARIESTATAHAPVMGEAS